MSTADRVTHETVSCAVCGGSAPKPFLRKFDLWISRCERCGFLFSNPRLNREDIWKRYSAAYFRDEYLPALGVRNGQYDLAFFDRRYEPMLRLISREVFVADHLLEIGAGAGFFGKAAERAGWRVSGIEVSPEAVAFARERLGLDVRSEAAEQMSFPPASFDAAVMFDVIEHLLDPRRALEAVRDVLRPGGLLVVTTPNIHALSRLGLGRQWAVLSPAEHLSYFSEATLRPLLERTGFRRVRFERRYAGFGVYETMNPNYTHAPDRWRARLYRVFVKTAGRLVYRWVQALGKGDTLLCLARKP